MLRGKIVLVGAGFVGSTTAYTIMLDGFFREIVLIDVNKDKADGDALDMAHGTSFLKPVSVYSGDWKDCAGADIVVITAGVNQKVGETRIDLLKRNTEIFKSIVENVMKHAPTDVILLTVTNPVDILTYVTYKLSGLPKQQIIGSGTVLDTSRLKYLISKHTGIDARYCHTYIIGEHGDSELAAWSNARIGGLSVNDFCELRGHFNHEASMKKIFDDVKNSAYEIIERKHATYYGIAMAVKRICEAIVRNEKSILPVSSLMTGEYGLNDVVLSIPSVVGENGVEKVVPIGLSDDEMAELKKSADILKDIAKDYIAK